MAWLSGWSHAKEIFLTGQTGAGTLYQVDLDIGDSAGGDFHLDGNCTNFPQDIEITDNDGTTLLDFSIEDITADPLTLWVEVADDLGSNQSIWVYYGKSGASTNSDGDATFVLYTGLKTTDYVSALTVSGAGYAYKGSLQFDQENTHLAPGFGDSAARFPTNSILFGSYIDDNLIRKVYVAGVEKLGVTGALTWTIDTPYIFEILWDSSGVKFIKDDVQWGTTFTGDTPTANMGIFNYYHVGTGQVNWQFIRKYNSPEPAFSSASSEYSAPRGLLRNPPMTGGMV